MTLDVRLLRNLRRFSGPQEAAAYLDFAADLFGGLGLAGDDPRFHFNPTGGRRYRLPFTVNNRYVLAGGPGGWWLLHPGHAEAQDWEAGRWLAALAFAHKRHDRPAGPPLLCLYPLALVLEHRAELLARTLELAGRDLAACRATPLRRAHSPLAFAAALDDTVRAEVWPALARPA